MAIDNKYGRVTTEHGNIGEDEPVVVFRAQDELLLPLLHIYRSLCQDAGSPERHLSIIDDTFNKVLTWQENNPTKTPDSESSRAWRGD